MTDPVWVDIAGLALLGAMFAAAVFLAAAETALVRVHKVRVAALVAEGSRRAGQLEPLIADLPRVLNAVLFAALLTQVGAATLTGWLAERRSGNIGVTVASVVLTLLLFVYAEVIPKTYAVRHSDRVALRVARPVKALAAVLRPVVTGLVWLADMQTPWQTRSRAPTVTEKELRMLAAEAARDGEITAADRDLVERGFRFGDTTAEQVMVPRHAIVSVPARASVGAALESALTHGHRRLVVCEDDIDSVLGFVRMRDLAALDETDPQGRVADAVRPVLKVEGDERIAAVLAGMQSKRTHVAIVVRGRETSGLLTIEDIVEELVGDIEDRMPAQRPDQSGRS